MIRKIFFVCFFLPMICDAKIVTRNIEYSAGDERFEGFLAYDDQRKNPPGILIVPDWMGVVKKAKDRAEQVAKLGYVAFSADVYGKGVRPKDSQEAGKLSGALKKDRDKLRLHVNAALDVLRKQPMVDQRKIAAIGYCFGGTAALELARAGAPLAGVVSFHGGLDSPNPEDGKNIKARVLALHGADDPFVSAADLAAFESEMRAANIDWQLVKYGGAVHGFTDKTAGTDASKGNAYNPRADKRSWRAMQDFLQDTFVKTKQ